MAFPSDLEIARGATLTPLVDIGAARTMAGLGTSPGATRINIDRNGEIVGLS
ncbi:MAG TPA: hypothetical protein VIY28_20505 [Pseudonocardiaceae bacterium]